MRHKLDLTAALFVTAVERRKYDLKSTVAFLSRLHGVGKASRSATRHLRKLVSFEILSDHDIQPPEVATVQFTVDIVDACNDPISQAQ